MILFSSGIQISDGDAQILQDRLENIEQWIRDALDGQINYAKSDMIDRWMPSLVEDSQITSIPKNKNDVVELIFSRPYYKNRSQRNAEEQAQATATFQVQ